MKASVMYLATIRDHVCLLKASSLRPPKSQACLPAPLLSSLRGVANNALGIRLDRIGTMQFEPCPQNDYCRPTAASKAWFTVNSTKDNHPRQASVAQRTSHHNPHQPEFSRHLVSHLEQHRHLHLKAGLVEYPCARSVMCLCTGSELYSLH